MSLKNRGTLVEGENSIVLEAQACCAGKYLFLRATLVTSNVTQCETLADVPAMKRSKRSNMGGLGFFALRSGYSNHEHAST